MMTHDTEGGDGPQHRSSVHIKLEHQGNLRMVQHGLRTIQTLHTSVRERATGHTFWHRNLIFGLNDPWDMRKKLIIFVFRNFHFYAFYRHFSFFPLYNTSCFPAACLRLE